MPRLRQVPRAEADPRVLNWYDLVFGDRCPVDEPGTATGTPGDWWPVFANSPDILDHCGAGFLLYRDPNRRLDPQLRELAQTRVGWTVQSRFVFSQHAKSCREVGIPEEKIGAIPNWEVATCFTDVERAVLAWTDGLSLGRGRVADGVFDELRRHLDDVEILELTYITMLYDMHGVMSRALRTEFDDVPEVITEVPAPGDDQTFRLR